MNIDGYKRTLLDLRARLAARLSAAAANAREQRLDVPGDSADAGIIDESQSEDFSEAELDSAVLVADRRGASPHRRGHLWAVPGRWRTDRTETARRGAMGGVLHQASEAAGGGVAAHSDTVTMVDASDQRCR